MGFKDLHLKLNAFRVRRFLIGYVDGKKKKKREVEFGKRPSWIVPVTHGYHVVDYHSFVGESDSGSDPDSVVVQREQIGEVELWSFGIFDATIGDKITMYLQSHLFDKAPIESHLKRKSKETLKKAYGGARVTIREAEKSEEEEKVGSASAIVINAEKLVIAHMGDYGAVVCRDGEAHQIRRKQRNWSRKLIPGGIRMPKVRILAWDAGNAGGTNKPSKSSGIVVGDERIDSDTEFVILASTGIWKVMKHQEAVNLIRHMEDPQEAAECLAKEAIIRMSRSKISCLVIRFE